MANVIVYGGAFDPFHYGHMQTAMAARNKLLEFEHELYEVWFTPSYYDTFGEKELTNNAAHRLEMLKLALKYDYGHIDNTLICTLELDNKNKMGTYELMTQLQKQYPGYNFKFLMGADSANSIKRWRNSRKLRREFSMVVVSRTVDISISWNDRKIRQTLRPTNGWITNSKRHIGIFDTATKTAVSSTSIRDAVKHSDWPNLHRMVSPSVLEYIQAHGLYKGEQDELKHNAEA